MRRMASALLASLVAVVPVWHQQGSKGGIGKQPADCDDFCRALRTVLESRANGFKDIAIGTPGEVRPAPAKVTLPGAEHCGVTAERNYECAFPTAEQAKEVLLLNDLIKRIGQALPAGWSEPEKAKEWMIVFEHGSEQPVPITLTIMPDLFGSEYRIDLTVTSAGR